MQYVNNIGIRVTLRDALFVHFNPRPTKGGGVVTTPLRFVSGRTKTQKKVTPGI